MGYVLRTEAEQTMNSCAATRLLVPAFLVGFTVASLTGRELLGWVAAAVTVVALVTVRRIRGTAASCPIAPPSGASLRATRDDHRGE
jgi:hypothetical protein